MSRNQHHRQRDHFGSDLDTAVVTSGTVGSFPAGTPLHDALASVATVGLSIILEGFGSPILTGNRGWVEVPFDGEIVAAKLLADQACNITVDIWKSTFVAFPPDAGDSICASAKLQIAGTISSYSFLTGWTTTITAGDILWFHVDSNDVASMLTIALTIGKG